MFVVIGLLVVVVWFLVIAMFPPTLKCRSVGCRAVNPVEARFCRRCGTAMNEKLILRDRGNHDMWGYPMKIQTRKFNCTPDARARSFAVAD